MTPTKTPQSKPTHSGLFAFALLAGLFGSFLGLVAIPVFALADVPVWAAPLLPLAVVGAAATLWNTQFGLCFAAFAIAPLGILQYEFAGVTVNLPELLILALFIKEAGRFGLNRERVARVLPRKLLLAYLMASLVAIATGLFAGNGAVRALQDFRQFTEYIALYLLVLHRVSSRRQILQVLVSFLLGMTVVGFHGIAQRFTGIGIPGSQLLSDMVYHEVIRSGSFYGATPLGGMMVLAVGVAAGLALRARTAKSKALAGLCAVVCVSAAVFTNTRASWLAMFVCFVFVFISVRKTPGLVALVVIGATLFIVTLGPVVLKRMGTLEISKRERSLLTRLRYYEAAWHIARAKPVFGLGWGCYYDITSILKNRRYVHTPMPERIRATFSSEEATVHSAYLQLLVKTGFLGLIPFLLLLARWFLDVVRERHVADRNEQDHNLLIGIVGGLIGYLFHSGFENFFQWPVMSQSFWLLLGLSTITAAAIAHRERGRDQEPSGCVSPPGPLVPLPSAPSDAAP